MSNAFEIAAETRSDVGKGASRRLRRLQKKVPGIIYGGSEAPVNITLEHRHIIKALENEAFYSHILTVNLDGKPVKTVLKDLQRHPYKPQIMHVDFLRVTGAQILHMHIPLHFLGEEKCPGVKDGGVISHQMKDVEVACRADKLPEFIEIDLSNLELNQVVHLSDIKLPEGVEILALTHGEEHDLPVVSIHIPRAIVEEEPEAKEGDEAAEGEEGAEQAEGEAKPEGEGEQEESKDS